MRSLLPNFEGADGRLVIGGQRLDGGETFAVVDPARGEPFAEVRSARLEDGDRAVAAAADALPAWIATAPRQRSEVLRRTFDLMTPAARSSPR